MGQKPTKTAAKRRLVQPPHVSLGALRRAKGMTLEQVCDRITEHLDLPADKPFTRGALSGIELGYRGPSTDVLDALEFALDLEPGDLVTTYQPSANTRRKSAA